MSDESEGATRTFDGRKKSEHLASILASTIQRLAISGLSPSFYVSLVSFAGNASTHKIEMADIAHISHVKSFVEGAKFHYLNNATGNGTNIMSALSTSVDVIDQALSDPKNADLALFWHALIILVTDGLEGEDKQAILQFTGGDALQRPKLKDGTIRLGCVGIGQDCDIGLLTNMASKTSEEVFSRLVIANVASRLLRTSDDQPVLALHVSADDPSYITAVRLFIDALTLTRNG
jgi:hypothetical protein